MTAPRLLIFPLDLDDADPVIRIATALGIEVIGASSAMVAPVGRAVHKFLRLPFITDPAFDTAFDTAMTEHGITAVFAPHQGVWRHLRTRLAGQACPVPFQLCQPDPFTATWELFAPHEAFAATAHASQSSAQIGATLRPALSQAQYAALHRQFLNTPGQCDEAKLYALCDIARLLPVGDLLEVGCLYGRSALALGFLAARHRIGSLVCVDPWNAAKLTDQGMDAAVLNAEHMYIDFQRIFRIFLSAAALLDNVGYIRQTSAAALPIYEAARRAGRLDSPELGTIELAPCLSLLHVDGNHRYDHVKLDVTTWSPFLAPGGWLLLDDYLWAFGDGPRRVGDELLDSHLYDLTFVSGDTLFLRRNDVAFPRQTS